MNDPEQTRSNPAVSPQNSQRENRYDFGGKNFVMSNGKMASSENSSFQDPDLLCSTPSTNLLTELRETRQSPQEHRATVRTSCTPRQEIILACEFAMSS